jgi:hypothetical protein
MAETIDEITIKYEDEDGTLVVRELAKEVLTRGAWTTIMFLYQELDRKTGEYGPEKVSIRRYRKINGVFRQQSKFNISNAKQAMKISEALTNWFS